MQWIEPLMLHIAGGVHPSWVTGSHIAQPTTPLATVMQYGRAGFVQPRSPEGESIQVTHRLLPGSHVPVGAMQPRETLMIVSHAPHVPARGPLVMHAVPFPSHAMSAAETGVTVLHATHVLVLGEQTGLVGDVHCALVAQATHTPDVVSQCGVPD